MSHAQAKLPGGIELEVVTLAATALIPCAVVTVIIQIRIVTGGKIIEGRRSHRDTDTERRLLNGKEDQTSLDIEARTFDLTSVANSHGATITSSIYQCLAILTISLIVHILDTHGQAPIETIIDIAAQVKIIIGYPTTMCTVETIGSGIYRVDFAVVGIEHQCVSIHIVGLTIRP